MPLPQPEPKSGGSPAGRGPRRPLRDVGRGGGPASLSARCPGLAATGGPVGRALRARGRRGAAPAGRARPGRLTWGGKSSGDGLRYFSFRTPTGPGTFRFSTLLDSNTQGYAPHPRRAPAPAPPVARRGPRVRAVAPPRGTPRPTRAAPLACVGLPAAAGPAPRLLGPLASSRHHAGPGRVCLMSVPWGPAAAPRVRVDARRRSPDALPSGPSAPRGLSPAGAPGCPRRPLPRPPGPGHGVLCPR